MATATKTGLGAAAIIGALGGILGGIWLIIWPFLSWPLGNELPSLLEIRQDIGMRDIVYGVLMIIFTIGCLYGFNFKLGGITMGHVSLYGMLLLSLALLFLPFILGYNTAVLGIPAGRDANIYGFWNDVITGLVSLPFTLYYLIPRKPKQLAM